ncbi:MAG: ERF family protein [Clostridia bacterium]
METEKINIYKKIQKVKKELSERELKKSGKNTFSGFEYYELGDFMPSIIELCDKYGLFTKIDFVDNKDIKYVDIENTYVKEEVKVGEVAKLTIINIDNPEEIEVYTCDVKELSLKGANSIQNYGGVQTYLRRYLYMNAFDIVEADTFDNESFEKKKKAKKNKGALDILVEKSKDVFKNADDKTKSKIADTMKTLGYTSFADVSKKQDKNDIISLASSLKIEIPEELKEEI